MAQVQLQAQMNVVEYSVRVAALLGSTASIKATVRLRVIAPVTGAQTLETLEYSAHNQIFEPLTLETPVTTVQGSPEGIVTELVWDIYEDMGVNFYNTPIKIRARITDGTHTSALSTGTFQITKVVVPKPKKGDYPLDANVTGQFLPSGLKGKLENQ
jgi:hypothetical protein